jgi:tetratricopeptide (TPR) repeat protein
MFFEFVGRLSGYTCSLKDQPGLSTPELFSKISLLFAAALMLGAAANQGAEQKLAQAVALARAHRFAEADEELKGVSAPSDPKQGIAFHRLRASIQAALQKPEEASAEMHAALRLAPADASLLRATAVADLGWLDAQLKASSHPGLKTTLEDLRAFSLPDRERAQLRSQMGERLLIAREYRNATVDLSEAVRLDPSRSEAWAQLADAQLHSGDPKGALESALHARTLHDTGELEGLLGDIYETEGDSVASAKSFEEAVRLSPGEERFALALAVELMRHKTFQPALTVLERCEVDFPHSPRTRTALGLALFLSGREPEGTTKLLEALSLDPAFLPAVRYLGELALGRPGGPEPRVIEAECKYADAHPSDNESNAICGGLEARAKSEDSPTAEWRPILLRLASAATSPDSAIAHCEYGKALDQTHDWPHARKELETCTRLGPDSVEAHYRLSRVYRRLGLKELAEKEASLRTAAERRETAANDARENSVKEFLYTMSKR